jgi:hypothetical protein
MLLEPVVSSVMVAGCLSMPAEPEMEAVGATPVPKNEDPKGLYERNIE